MHPVILLIALVAVLLFVSWYKRAPATQRRTVRNRGLVWGGIGLVLLLAMTGRLNPVFAAAAALVPLAYRVLGVLQLAQTARTFRNTFKSARGPTAGQTSDVETRFLRMVLDHDSGDMRGEVLDGRFRGRRLEDLELDQLVQLWEECRSADAQSAAVLEAYLDRFHGDAWRERVAAAGAGEPGGGAGAAMGVEEARQILGVGPGASREEIVDAHRRLMQKLHPDRGGSTYLAAQINRAKEVLLG